VPAPEDTPAPLPRPYDFIRVAHPGRSMALVQRKASLDFPLGSDFVAALMTGDNAGAMIDLDAPADFVVVDWKRAAGRVGLRPGADVLLRDRFHATESDGALRFTTPEHVCEARGASLYCATDDAMLTLAVPHLRALAREPLGSEAEVRLLFPDQAEETPPSSDVDEQLGLEAARTLFYGAGDATLDVSTAGGITLRGTVAFDDPKTPEAHWLLGSGGPAPDAMFRRLPADARVALATGGFPAADLVRIRALVGASFAASVQKDGFPEAYARESADAFLALVVTGGPLVLAGGYDARAVERAGAAYRAHATDATYHAAQGALGGWFVAGVDEEPERWLRGVAKIVALDHAKVKRTPPAAKAGGATKDDWSETVTEREATAPPGAPPRTMHLVLTTVLKHPPKDAIKTPRTAHLLVVPDGRRTWLVYAPDPALAVEKAAALVSPAAGLGSRPDAATCTPGATTCVLFRPDALIPLSPVTKPKDVADALQLADRARSLAPTTMTLRVVPRGGHAEVLATVPWQAIDELVTLTKP